MTEDIYDMEVKIGNFTDKFVIPPLENSISRMKKVADFNFTELKTKINDSICSFNKEFIETFNNEELLLEKIKKELKDKNLSELYDTKKESLKETFDEFKKKADEKLNSTIINDLLDKISQINVNISEKLNNSEIKDKAVDLISKIKKIREENANTTISQKLDELKVKIQSNALEKVVTNLDLSMTNFNNKIVGDLMDIQKKVEKINELREKYKDSNDTAKEIIDKLKEELQKKKEEVKIKTEEYVDKHPILKPLVEKLKEKEGEVKDKLKDKGVYDKLADYKKEFEELQDLVEKLNKTNNDNLDIIKKLIKQRLDKINGKQLVKQMTIVSQHRKELEGEMKNFTLIESSLEKLRNIFNSTKVGNSMDNQKEKARQLLNHIQNKIKTFMDDKATLKITKGIINKVNDKMDNAGLIDAINEFLKNASNVDDKIKDSILDRINGVNKTIYNIEEKVKEINGTDIKLKLDNFKDKAEDLSNISLTIEKLKAFWNTPEEQKKEKIEKLLNDLKDKINNSELIKPVVGRVKEFEINLDNTGLPDSVKSHIEKIKDLKKSLETLDLKNKEKVKETLYKLHEQLDKKIEGINGAELLLKVEEPFKDLPNLNLTLQNIKNILDDKKLKNKGKLDKLEKMKMKIKTKKNLKLLIKNLNQIQMKLNK